MQFCKRCGRYVSKWHRHWTNDKIEHDAVLAQSEWMKGKSYA